MPKRNIYSMSKYTRIYDQSELAFLINQRYDELCEVDRRWIDYHSRQLIENVRGIGMTGAQELLYKLGRFFNDRWMPMKDDGGDW